MDQYEEAIILEDSLDEASKQQYDAETDGIKYPDKFKLCEVITEVKTEAKNSSMNLNSSQSSWNNASPLDNESATHSTPVGDYKPNKIVPTEKTSPSGRDESTCINHKASTNKEGINNNHSSDLSNHSTDNNSQEAINSPPIENESQARTLFKRIMDFRLTSLRFQLLEAKKNSTSTPKYVGEAIRICACFFLFLLGNFLYVALISIVSIAKIIMGLIYIEECTVQPIIPVFLTVWGSIGVLHNILNPCWCCKAPSCFTSFLDMLSIVMLIFGAVLVFGVKEVVHDNALSDMYCNKNIFLFSFWMLIYTFLAMLFLCCHRFCNAAAAKFGVKN